MLKFFSFLKWIKAKIYITAVLLSFNLCSCLQTKSTVHQGNCNYTIIQCHCTPLSTFNFSLSTEDKIVPSLHRSVPFLITIKGEIFIEVHSNTKLVFNLISILDKNSVFTYFATKRNSDESKIRYVYVRQFHNELYLFLKLLSTGFVLKFLEYQERKTSFSQASRQSISDVTLNTKTPEKKKKKAHNGLNSLPRQAPISIQNVEYSNKEFGCLIHLTRSVVHVLRHSTEILLYIYILQNF